MGFVISLVKKRNGELVLYDRNKIAYAVYRAFVETREVENPKEVADKVAEEVEKRLIKERLYVPEVEQIQDIVEQTLMDMGYFKTARAYIIYREERKKIREAKKMLGVKDDLKLTLNAIKVLEKRYLLKDDKGRVIETPRQMFWRVAKYIALVDIFYYDEIYDISGKCAPQIYKGEFPQTKLDLGPYEKDMLIRAYNNLSKEGHMKVGFEEVVRLLEDKWDEIMDVAREFNSLMINRYFIPNSPTLMNANTRLGQLSACFVLPVEDSIDGIYKSLWHAAKIHQSGGGTGFSFSRLRPEGDIVGSTKGVASGPVSFMRIYDVSTDIIKQGGKRRGANMGILSVHHPDIEKFILSKDPNNKILSNFNISVAITDEFMDALENDAEYPLINPRTNEVVRYIRARKIWDMIVNQAWATGDPGIIFIDEINRHNPTPHLGMIESTNPCGEQPLLPYESCNLGSINLSLMVENGEILWDRLRKVVHTAVHFLDNVIDANKFPIPEIEHWTRKNRKIGLGVMGWAEMLIKLGIPYDSMEAVELAEKVMKFIQEESHRASEQLAEKRGTFPAWEGSVWWEKGRKMRNATTTTIAPTGTISIIAGTSSGIEPLFAIAFQRRVLEGETLLEINPIFERMIKERGLYSKELMYKVARTGSVQGIEEIPEDLRRIFVTAHDVDPKWHLLMQAAFQKYTDNAVSKTINLRHDVSVETVDEIFRMAYRLKLKGITIYRDRSKRVQVIYRGVSAEKLKEIEKAEKKLREEKEEKVQLKLVDEKYLTLEEGEEASCPKGTCDD